jgi:hypothetical protein
MIAAAAGAALALAGCGGSDPLANLPPGCRAKLPECLATQKICVAGPQCQACPEGQYATQTGVCSPIGTAITHDFSDFTSQAGQEILGLCQSWTLHNADEIWVNAVELDQNEASHHSNWLFVPDDRFDGPDGVWPCRDRMYDELSAALAGGVLYAQSTQATHEVQKFPNGAAVRIPPYSRIISDVHILNATNQAITGHARLSLYPLPLAEVKHKLAPFHLTFNTLDIPPNATSRTRGECELDSQFQAAFNHPLDAKIYFILPHYHALGRRLYVERYGGTRDGEVLLDAQGAVGEARGRAFDPPYDMTGADGLRFGCEFDNNTASAVHWGFGDQEMCELLGFTDSPLAWESSVRMIAVDPMFTDEPTYSGPCGTISFEYDFTKAGGKPPDGGTTPTDM